MLERLAKSKWFDLLGVAIVLVSCILSGYLTETLHDVLPIGEWTTWVPFGLISIGSSILSLYSTRLTGRLNNLGNYIGLANTVLSGTIDYILGNKGAILTYPITFIIQAVAIKVWVNSEAYRAKKPLTGTKGKVALVAVFILSMLFSYFVNLIAYGTPNVLFYVTVVVFGLSMCANALNAMKLSLQWNFWFVYNLVQFVKAVVQGNWANVGKYIYYVINSIADLKLWKGTHSK